MTSPTQSAMEQQQREDLHARIMNLPCNVPAYLKDAEIVAYRAGHMDARHAAFELAASQASELRSLRDSLALARSRIAELEGDAQPSELKLALHQLHQLAAHFHGTNADDGQCDLAMNFLSQFDEEGNRAALNKEQP